MFADEIGVICAAIQQLLGVRAGYYRCFSPLFHVDIVDKATFNKVDFIHFGNLWITARKRYADFFVLPYHVKGALSNVGCDIVNMVGKQVTFSQFNIFVIQIDIPSLFQSVVRHGGIAAENHHGIGSEIAAVVHESVHQAVARAQKYYQHENSPCHREASQACTQFVAFQGFPYFDKQVLHA